MEDVSIDVRPIIAVLAERFPAAFFVFEQRRRPLKLGIYDDLIERLGGELSDLDLSAALRCYCGNSTYLNHCREGVGRLDLDGNVCGTVSAEHAENARKRLEGRRAKRAAKTDHLGHMAKTPPAPIAAPIPPAIEATDQEIQVPEGSDSTPIGLVSVEESKPKPPKRLGLADLRAAALARKEKEEVHERRD
jgi:ProP effector